MKLIDAKIGYYKKFKVLIEAIEGYELKDDMLNLVVDDPYGNLFYCHADGMKIEDAVALAQEKIDEYLECFK